MMLILFHRRHLIAGFISFALLISCGAPPAEKSLVLYSGRSENLVGPLIEDFTQSTGIKVSVKYGETAELAATLLAEGAASPADLFFAQEPGGLGLVKHLLKGGHWEPVSGRARVAVYNPRKFSTLPDDIFALTDPQYRIGWAPANASFQTMVTAMRKSWGEEKTREWLAGIQANNPRVYPKNAPIIEAVAAGDIDVGLANHYYLQRFLKEEGETYPARNHFFPFDRPEGLIMYAGVGVLASSKNQEAAGKFVRFLLSPEAQNYFRTQTFEYPAGKGDWDVEDLADMAGTQKLLRDLRILN